MDQVEQISKRMRLLALAIAAGFFAWQVGDGMARSPQIGSELTGAAYIASGIGLGMWVVSLIIFFGQAWQAKKSVGYDVLNDEWAIDVRKRAGETAFWVVTVGVVLSMTATNFGADGQLLLKVLTGVSASSFLVASVYFDSRGEGGDEE